LLLLCVYRPERENRVWRLQEAVARDYPHRQVWLQSLSQDEGESLIDNLLGAEGLPDRLVERILSHAEGNPFYLEEVLRSLIGEGVIVQDMATGRWQATRDAADITIPDTLQGVLLARIDRLQQETKRVLQMASVIGRIFLYRLLAEIAHEEQLLDSRLLSLQQAEMIRERARLPELEYIFKHHLTQEAAYNGLLKKERRVFHRQVGQALERLFHDRLEEQAGLLAYHWERARDAEKAVKYLQQAGDAVRLAYAHEEAVDYYRRALAFQREQRDHEGAGRTFMKLGVTFHSAFDYEASCKAYDEGFGLLQRAAQVRPAVELPPAPHAFRISLPAPSKLDPTRAAGLISNIYIDQLFSGLVELSPELDVLPDVAHRWKVADGGRKYVFYLRDDVCWSDGVPLTAQDFEYAWKRLLAPATGFLVASILFDIKGARAFHQGEAASADHVEVQALDDRTLQVMLEHPTAYFLQLLTSSMGRPVPRHVVDAHGESWTDLEHIVTCGPFQLESYEPGAAMVLARDPDYHGRRSGNLQRVEVNHVTCWTDGGKLAAYEDGSLDIGASYDLPTRERHWARERHAGQYVQYPALWLDFAGFDARRRPFADARVRRAFVMATDKQALADIYRRGWYVPATGGFVPPRMPGHSPDIGLPYDPPEARRLLAEAGYPGSDGFPIVLARKGGLVEPEAEHLSARWREILGVAVEWLDPGDERPAHLFVTGWFPVYPDPDCLLRVSIPVPATPGWRSEVYEGLVERAGRLTDHAERMKLYAQADRILMEEAAILPLFYGRMHGILKPWIKSFPLSPMSFWFWKDVIIEPH
jgi:oligopeptide transport system substrate-binding protein